MCTFNVKYLVTYFITDTYFYIKHSLMVEKITKKLKDIIEKHRAFSYLEMKIA
jgi:hypothetical protein